MTTYTVFKRRPYKRTAWGYAPHPGAHRTVIRRNVESADAARSICAQGPANIARDAGCEYRGLMFYEYTSEDI